MTLLSKARVFGRVVKTDGLTNAITLAGFTLFPRAFAALARRVVSGGSVSELSATNYLYAIQNVQDYKLWTEYGGSDAPATSSDSQPCYIWFVPDWLNVWGGGHYTLFRFANHFAKGGSRNIIFVYDNQRHTTPDKLQKELDNALDDCKIEVIVDPKKLPQATGAIATTWQSAYKVRAFPHAQHKFYFMQDYEGLFYAYGTQSMQANATYTFGFSGITGGEWLRQCYESHGGKAINYRFVADTKIFYPAEAKVRDKVRRLFFYGRPSTERRCFDLGIAALALIKKKYPEVEIIIGGLDLSSPPPFQATLLGNMTLAQTGDLYRTCDIGLAFSGTNLSYLPVELMASGVPVISNNGPHVEWHCQHLENSYLADPVPHAVLAAFEALLESAELRQRLVDGGLETMRGRSWDAEMTRVYDHVSQVSAGGSPQTA